MLMTTEPTPPPLPKSRHGCLTITLVLKMIGGAATLFIYTLGASAIKAQYPGAPDWTAPVLAGVGMLNIIFAIALFRWKFWGFAGFVFSAIITTYINFMLNLEWYYVLGGFVGVAILYGVLQINDNNDKGWTQLE